MTEVISIAAIIAAPILAVQAQWFLQLRREKRERKIWIFKTLMASRGARLSPEHVRALNLIDVEFKGRRGKEKEVREAWRLYLDHLNTSRPTDATGATWDNRMIELLVILLYKMAGALGFDFDQVSIKNGIYVPIGHGELENDLLFLRKGLLSLLAGNLSIKMDVQSFPMDPKIVDAQLRQLELSIQYLEGRRPLPVTVVQGGDIKAIDTTPPDTPKALPPATGAPMQGLL